MFEEKVRNRASALPEDKMLSKIPLFILLNAYCESCLKMKKDV